VTSPHAGLLEVSRRRSTLTGLDKPTVFQLEGPGDTSQQQHVPTLRELLPAEEFAEHSWCASRLCCCTGLSRLVVTGNQRAGQVGADLADMRRRSTQPTGRGRWWVLLAGSDRSLRS
jgi:hypothetical protein